MSLLHLFQWALTPHYAGLPDLMNRVAVKESNNGSY